MGKRPKVVGGVVVPDPKKHRILAPTLTGDQFMTDFLLRTQSRDEFDFLCGEGRLFYGIAKDIIYSLEGPLNRVPSPEYVDALQKGTCDLYRDQVVTAKLVSEATMLYLGGDVTRGRMAVVLLSRLKSTPRRTPRQDTSQASCGWGLKILLEPLSTIFIICAASALLRR